MKIFFSRKSHKKKHPKRRPRRLRRLLFDLTAVFIGALAAFLSERSIQNQIEMNQQRETLRSLQKEITNDTISIKSEIRSPYRKTKQKLVKRFKGWLGKGMIPQDSLGMLLNQMMYSELPSNIINFKMLHIAKGIDQISNLDLKRLIYEYYSDAEVTDKYSEKIAEENMRVIISHYDIRQLGTESNAEISTLKIPFIPLDQIKREIINRVLLCENEIEEIDQVLLVQELKADSILAIIARELSE